MLKQGRSFEKLQKRQLERKVVAELVAGRKSKFVAKCNVIYACRETQF